MEKPGCGETHLSSLYDGNHKIEKSLSEPAQAKSKILSPKQPEQKG
jgi:hypothetical protein